ncbi:MAG: Hpt domain-containing protein [Cyanobacteria bacterium HKST-UBA03]|nr:Hpt domain-containing protein [Cyanobacteria bacterium HKST-UBA03]
MAVTSHPSSDSQASLTQAFVEESLSQLSAITPLLEALARAGFESSGDTTAPMNEALTELMRVVHTIKGNAGFMDEVPRFQGLTQLCHKLEEAIGAVLSNQLPFDRAMATNLLAGADVLRECIAGPHQACQDIPHFSRVVAMLDALNSAQPATKAQGVPVATPMATPMVTPMVSPAPHGAQGAQGAQGADAGVLNTPEALLPANPPHAVRNDSIRVPVEVLDNLVQLASELVQLGNQLPFVQHEEIGPEIRQRFDQLSSKLQQTVMQTRQQPLTEVLGQYPRLVRHLANELAKPIDILLDVAPVQVDKALLDALNDTLVHLIRNACDHGIEPADQRRVSGKHEVGLIRLAACQQGDRLVVKVQDDGRGIDADALVDRAKAMGISADYLGQLSGDQRFNLMFIPGLSTAGRQNSFSGRGIGMDVAFKQIQSLGGQLTVQSRKGMGSVFTMTLPINVSTCEVLVVCCGDHTLALPRAAFADVFTLNQVTGKTIEWYPSQSPKYHGSVRMGTFWRLEKPITLLDMGSMPGSMSGSMPAPSAGNGLADKKGQAGHASLTPAAANPNSGSVLLLSDNTSTGMGLWVDRILFCGHVVCLPPPKQPEAERSVNGHRAWVVASLVALTGGGQAPLLDVAAIWDLLQTAAPEEETDLPTAILTQRKRRLKSRPPGKAPGPLDMASLVVFMGLSDQYFAVPLACVAQLDVLDWFLIRFGEPNDWFNDYVGNQQSVRLFTPDVLVSPQTCLQDWLDFGNRPDTGSMIRFKTAAERQHEAMMEKTPAGKQAASSTTNPLPAPLSVPFNGPRNKDGEAIGGASAYGMIAARVVTVTLMDIKPVHKADRLPQATSSGLDALIVGTGEFNHKLVTILDPAQLDKLDQAQQLTPARRP